MATAIDIELTSLFFVTVRTLFGDKNLSTRISFTKSELCIGEHKIKYEYIPLFSYNKSIFKLNIFAKLHDNKIIKSEKISNIFLHFDSDDTCKKFQEKLYDKMKYLKDYEYDTIDKSIFRFKSFREIFPKYFQSK
jgi:hypothetical protein